MAFEEIKVTFEIPMSASKNELVAIDNQFRNEDIYIDYELEENKIILESLYDYVDNVMLDGTFLLKYKHLFSSPFKTYYFINEPNWCINFIVFDGNKLWISTYYELDSALGLYVEDSNYDELIELANKNAAIGEFDEAKFPTTKEYFSEI